MALTCEEFEAWLAGQDDGPCAEEEVVLDAACEVSDAGGVVR